MTQLTPLRRILVAPLNYDHPQDGQLHAFRGIFGPDQVLEFDYMAQQRLGLSNDAVTQRFVDAAKAFKPDWIWLQVQGANVLQPWGVEQLRRALPTCVVTHWTGDARRVLPPDLIAMCRATHATFVSSVGQLPLYLAAGAPRVQYLQIGLDWAEDVMGWPDWTPPFRVPAVVFLGNHYGDMFGQGALERLAAVRQLRDEPNLDFGVVGRGWPSDIPVVGECTVKQQHHVWQRAQVAINVNHFNDLELYYSDRQLIAMASGTPVVCRYVPGLEQEFTHGVHCLWYRELDDLVAHTRRLLAEATLRQTLGSNGRHEVLKRHTWFSRVLAITPYVEELRQQLATMV